MGNQLKILGIVILGLLLTTPTWARSDRGRDQNNQSSSNRESRQRDKADVGNSDSKPARNSDQSETIRNASKRKWQTDTAVEGKTESNGPVIQKERVVSPGSNPDTRWNDRTQRTGAPLVRENKQDVQVKPQVMKPQTRSSVPADRPNQQISNGQVAQPREMNRASQRTLVRPKPVVFKDDKQILREPKSRSFVPPPSQGPEGRQFRSEISHRPPPATVNVFNDVSLNVRINDYNRREMEPGRYYWHRDGGRDLCHYYDRSNIHWYGWNIGLDFYWTRWHAGYWWWYDRQFDRWCYWNQNNWWWPEPDHPNVVYVYIDNKYVPSDEVPAEVQAPVEAPPAEVAPAQQESDQFYRNKKMDRMVSIFGEKRDAFLYDSSDKPSFRPIFLATGVKEVQMSDDSNGKPLQILVTKEDGSFEIFDAKGKAYLPSKP